MPESSEPATVQSLPAIPCPQALRSPSPWTSRKEAFLLGFSVQLIEPRVPRSGFLIEGDDSTSHLRCDFSCIVGGSTSTFVQPEGQALS